MFPPHIERVTVFVLDHSNDATVAAYAADRFYGEIALAAFIPQSRFINMDHHLVVVSS